VKEEEGSAVMEVCIAGSVEDAALLRVPSDQQQRDSSFVVGLVASQNCGSAWPLHTAFTNAFGRMLVV
jgi:hypothetical protein